MPYTAVLPIKNNAGKHKHDIDCPFGYTIRMTSSHPVITCIVAISDNGVIGFQNQLPWYIPEDLAFFRKATMNHTVIMGKNTWLSIGRPLDGRKNIVLSTSINPDDHPDITVCHNLDQLFDQIRHEETVFVIGGETVYQELLPFAHRLQITRIHHAYQGDTFFPTVNQADWQLIQKTKGISENFDYPFDFEEYQRATLALSP